MSNKPTVEQIKAAALTVSESFAPIGHLLAILIDEHGCDPAGAEQAVREARAAGHIVRVPTGTDTAVLAVSTPRESDGDD